MQLYNSEAFQSRPEMEAWHAELVALGLVSAVWPLVTIATGLPTLAPVVLALACCRPGELLGAHMCSEVHIRGHVSLSRSDTWLTSPSARGSQ